MPQWAVLLERQAHFLCPLLSRSVADGGAKAGHTSPYRGRSVLHRGERSQRAQAQSDRQAAFWGGAWVSRYALLQLHLTAGATQPLHWPSVPCGARGAASFVFLPVPSGLFHTGHVPGDRPIWRAGYVRSRNSVKVTPRHSKPNDNEARLFGSLMCAVIRRRLCSGLSPRSQRLPDPIAIWDVDGDARRLEC